MRRAEMIAALVVFLLGLHVIQQSSLLPYTEKYGPGPGFLPFWLGWAWVGLAVLHAANLMLQPWLYSGKQPFPSGRGAIRVIALYVSLLVTVLLMGSLGLLTALVAMVLAILRGIERERWRSSAFATVAISSVSYILFAVVLAVPFPKGPLGV